MALVSRTEFTQLSRNGGHLDLNRMPDSLRTTLRESGISDQELNRIAGQDHVIRGEAEFRQLFARIDRLDTNGSSRSIETERRDPTDARRTTPTASGRVFNALNDEITANRERVAREGGMRFAGDRGLENVAAGRAVLEMGSTGEGVRRVQQALTDVGALPADHGVTGDYDRATRDAVRRFQRDTGLQIDGQVGSETLSALAATAPAPGQQIERSAEYDRMYADGRLDVTLAVGFDEGTGAQDAERGMIRGLREQGYSVLDPSAMTDDQRRHYGLTADRYDSNARYFARTFQDPQSGRDITAVVRMITPGADGERARASFEQAMRQDEVVMYNGHARYGTGPDFDDINSGRGNYVIDSHGNRRHETPPAGLRESIRGRSTDLSTSSQRPDYQMLVFNGCNTEEYLHNLRNPAVSGRSMTDTDIISTQGGPEYMWTGEPAMRFLAGLTSREANNTMLRDQAAMEQAHLRRYPSLAHKVPEAGHTFVESGFIGNAQNRTIPSTSSTSR